MRENYFFLNFDNFWTQIFLGERQKKLFYQKKKKKNIQIILLGMTGKNC